MKNKSQPQKDKGKKRETRKTGAAKTGMKNSQGEEEKMRTKKYSKAGTIALRDIKKYQKYEKRLCGKAALVRRIRDCMSTYDPDMRIKAVAVDCIHEAAESYLLSMLEDASLCTFHAKRLTLYKKDVQLALRIRGDKTRTFY